MILETLLQHFGRQGRARWLWRVVQERWALTNQNRSAYSKLSTSTVATAPACWCCCYCWCWWCWCWRPSSPPCWRPSSSQSVSFLLFTLTWTCLSLAMWSLGLFQAVKMISHSNRRLCYSHRWSCQTIPPRLKGFGLQSPAQPLWHLHTYCLS